MARLEKLANHLSVRLGREAWIVVWAHYSHLGNAAATDMGRRGKINIGHWSVKNAGTGGFVSGSQPAVAR